MKSGIEYEKALEYAEIREEEIRQLLGENSPVFPGVMIAIRIAYMDGSDWMKGRIIPSHEKTILSLEEAAMYLHMSKANLHKHTSQKTIPHYKPEGKSIYFKREDLDAWALRNRVC